MPSRRKPPDPKKNRLLVRDPWSENKEIFSPKFTAIKKELSVGDDEWPTLHGELCWQAMWYRTARHTVDNAPRPSARSEALKRLRDRAREMIKTIEGLDDYTARDLLFGLTATHSGDERAAGRTIEDTVDRLLALSGGAHIMHARLDAEVKRGRRPQDAFHAVVRHLCAIVLQRTRCELKWHMIDDMPKTAVTSVLISFFNEVAPDITTDAIMAAFYEAREVSLVSISERP